MNDPARLVMRHRLYFHLAWTTLDRAALINLASAEFLADVLPRLAHRESAEVLELGIVSTHVHLLIRAQPSVAIPMLFQRLKGASAAIGRKQHGLPLPWAKGYNIESVSHRAIAAVGSYVSNQHKRHPHEAIPGWPRPTQTISAPHRD